MSKQEKAAMPNEQINRNIYELFLSSRIRKALRSDDPHAASEIFQNHSNSMLYGLVCQPIVSPS
jgi:hypothetical protein